MGSMYGYVGQWIQLLVNTKLLSAHKGITGSGVRGACILMVNFWATDRKNRAPSIVFFFATSASTGPGTGPKTGPGRPRQILAGLRVLTGPGLRTESHIIRIEMVDY